MKTRLITSLLLIPIFIACKAQTILLDGTWNFSFNGGRTTTIKVPGNWELQGFCEPQYGKDLKDNHGIYSKSVFVPKSWKGKRVLIDLDGVCFGYTLTVNGKDFGTFSSAFTLRSHDITPAIRFGKENTIEINVCTHPKGYEFDTNDDWSLSGISRHVVMYARPKNYIKSISVVTHLDGTVDVDCQFSGKKIPFKSEVIDLTGKPLLWTAETPHLYTLKVETKYETRYTKIGFREVSIIDGVFCINGQPVKLRGATHHDLSPVNGRAITREETLRDLIMMKRGNMNYVRTSHYPPTQDLLELCDSLGMYVMCEVPFGFGDEHLNDTSYLPLLKERALLTITANRNHPSIVVWSVGNENPVTALGLETGKYVYSLDPSRPYLFPQRGSLFKNLSASTRHPEHPTRHPELDSGSHSGAMADAWKTDASDTFMTQTPIYAPHYPSAADVKGWADRFDRPLIITEYAHSLGTDMGRMQDIWHIVRDSPRLAGGSVWELFDQGILRTSDKQVCRDSITDYAWTSPNEYYDTKSDLGTDGILYADRTPQTDYFQVRKVYSPVFIPDTIITLQSSTLNPQPSTISLPVRNYFDFTDLSSVNGRWELVCNGVTEKSGELALSCKPHSSSTITIPAVLTADIKDRISFIRLTFSHKSGYQFYERNIKLAPFPSGGVGVGFPSLREGSGVGFPFVKIGRKSTLSERATMAGAQGKKHKLAKHQLLESQPITDEETTEIGSAIVLPDTFHVMTWVGKGPYAAYPGKSELSEYGIWQTDRDGLYFPGNRQEVEMMSFTDTTGRGYVIVPQSPADISVEIDGSNTVISVNAKVSSPYNKNVWPIGTFKLDHIYDLPQYKVYKVNNLKAIANFKPTVCDVKHFYHVYDR